MWRSASSTLLALHSCGLAELSPAARKHWSEPASRSPCSLDNPGRPASIPGRGACPPRFFFDFKDYWCGPLGTAFGLADEDVLRLAGDVVTGTWAMPYSGDLSQDERRNHGVYPDNSTWTHAGERGPKKTTSTSTSASTR